VSALRDPNIAHVLLVSFAVLLFLGSFLCLAVGLGLLLRTSATLRVFGVMNRWVSTRRVLKPLEIPRTSDLHVADPRRRWVTGLFFAFAGGYAAYALATGAAAARLVEAFGVRGALVPVGIVLVDTLRWFFVVFCAVAVVLAVVLLVWPGAWPAIEARANRWYSTRRAIAGGDEMRLTLDRWVELYPRPAGVIVAVLSVVPLAGAAILLFGR
jgi:hypothetical protein